MRIAMITDSYYPTKDGVVTSVSIAKRTLEKRGHEVFIVAPDPGEKDRLEGVIYIKSIRFKSYDGYFIPIMPSRALRKLEKLRIDIIHIHGVAVMALRGLLYSRQLDIPSAMTFHTMVGDVLDFYCPVKLDIGFVKKCAWKYIRAIVKRTDALIVPSPSIEKELLSLTSPKRTEIIPTGTDVGRFHPGVDGSAFRKEHGLEGKVVASVGRLSYEKNIDMVIRAMKDVDAMLLIVGDGPAGPDLKNLAKELGMEDKVVFTGYIENQNVVYAYAASDMLVSASRFETQGLSVLEAMASGLPVACCDARAFHDIIRDGENGFLFSGEEDCADAIKRCLDASEEVRRNSLATALDNSEDKTAERLEKLYSELIEARRKRDGRGIRFHLWAVRRLRRRGLADLRVPDFPHRRVDIPRPPRIVLHRRLRLQSDPVIWGAADSHGHSRRAGRCFLAVFHRQTHPRPQENQIGGRQIRGFLGGQRRKDAAGQ
jgi:1,2-diacylglycerol 3-alpha-glucosyltransferase